MPSPRCLLCVHAHPDDEALFTAGVMARYAAEGVRSVLVTCTDGEPRLRARRHRPEGSRPRPRRRRHGAAVASSRRPRRCSASTGSSCSATATRGWWGGRRTTRRTRSSARTVDEVAGSIAAVIAEERPQVVVTYDANGFYGHPDHIATHRATMAAVAAADGTVEKVYFPAIPESTARGVPRPRRRRGDGRCPSGSRRPTGGPPTSSSQPRSTARRGCA